MSNYSKRGINNTDKKRISSLLALLSFTAYMPVSSLPAFADIAANQLPSLNNAANGFTETSGATMNVVVGNKTIDKDNKVTVTGKEGTVGQFDWNTFNVGKDATVNFAFTANSQTSLNRVLNTGGMSYIYGKLTNSAYNGCASCVDTSKVILINPSGMLFGNGSSVNLNSFTASTYDINGAKNLKDLSGAALSDYVGTGGETGTLWNIAGSPVAEGVTHKVEFLANDNMVNGTGYLTGDAVGAKLASIKTDKSTIKGDKAIAFVGNDIDITNGTTLQTHYDSSPNVVTDSTTGYGVNRANIKLVTGDGVNFYYASAGNMNSSFEQVAKTHDAKVADKEFGVSVEDSTIRSGGRTTIYTGGKLASGDIKNNLNIKNSTVFSKKLQGSGTTTAKKQENGTDGNMELLARTGDINITASNVQTTNDVKGTDTEYTKDLAYGKMTIQAVAGDINVTNSQLRTADSTANATASNITAGNINIVANKGSVNINKTSDAGKYGYSDGTGVVAAGNLTINAAQNVNIAGYDKIQAVGNKKVNSDVARNRSVKINANNIDTSNTLINAQTVNLNAKNTLTTDDTNLTAGNSLIAKSKNTLFDNSQLSYNDLTLYDDTKTSNVTFANGTTVHDRTALASGGDNTLRITTNGDLTINYDNLENKSGGKYNSYELKSTNNDVNVIGGSSILAANGDTKISAANGAISVDNSYVQSTKGNIIFNAKDDITVSKANGRVATGGGNVTLTSTSGNVVAKENSRILTTKGNVSVNANQNINVQSGAKIYTNNGKADLTATNGKLTVTGNSEAYAAGGNMTVTQGQTMNMDTDINNGTLATSGKLTINTTNGGFTSTQLQGGTGELGTYKDLISLNNDSANAHFIFAGDPNTASTNGRLTINSKGDITSNGFVSTNYVDLNSTNGNINLTNTKTGAGANVLLQNTTTNAKGTTNVSTANGALRANNYDIKGGTKTTLSGKTVKTDAGSDIDTKGNKLALNAPGDIDVTLRGMDKTKPANGLEVNADLDTHINQDVLTGRNVKIKAAADDGNLVVSKIKADTLDLVADHVYAGTTKIDKNKDHVNKYGSDKDSSGLSDAQMKDKAYIEVKTEGGFNMDKSSSYDGKNSAGSSIVYNENTDTSTSVNKTSSTPSDSKWVPIDGTQVTEKEYQKADSSKLNSESGYLVEHKESKGELVDEDTNERVSDSTIYDAAPGDPDYNPAYVGKTGHWIYTDKVTKHEKVVTDTYKGEERTKTTQTGNNYNIYDAASNEKSNQHVATLDSSQSSGFVLIYDKTKTTDTTVTENAGTSKKTTYGDWTMSNNTAYYTEVTTNLSKLDPSNDKNFITDTTTTKVWCPDSVNPGDDLGDDNLLFVEDVAATVKMVRKPEPTSDLTPIQNDKAVLTTPQVAAAAALSLEDVDGAESTGTVDGAGAVETGDNQEDDLETSYDY